MKVQVLKILSVQKIESVNRVQIPAKAVCIYFALMPLGKVSLLSLSISKITV